MAFFQEELALNYAATNRCPAQWNDISDPALFPRKNIETDSFVLLFLVERIYFPRLSSSNDGQMFICPLNPIAALSFVWFPVVCVRRCFLFNRCCCLVRLQGTRPYQLQHQPWYHDTTGTPHHRRCKRESLFFTFLRYVRERWYWMEDNEAMDPRPNCSENQKDVPFARGSSWNHLIKASFIGGSHPMPCCCILAQIACTPDLGLPPLKREKSVWSD